MTDRKTELIEGSRSEAQKEALALAEAMNESREPLAIMNKEMIEWVKTSTNQRIFDTDYELRRAMAEGGVKVFDKRIKFNSRLDYALMNARLQDDVRRTDDEFEKTKFIRAAAKRPSEIMAGGM
jgi:hypothetical protein